MQFHPIDFKLSPCHRTAITHNLFSPPPPLSSLLFSCPECARGSAIICTTVSGPACWTPINYPKLWGRHWRSCACRLRLCTWREIARRNNTGEEKMCRSRSWDEDTNAVNVFSEDRAAASGLLLNYTLCCLMRTRDEHPGLTHAPCSPALSRCFCRHHNRPSSEPRSPTWTAAFFFARYNIFPCRFLLSLFTSSLSTQTCFNPG